MNGKKARQLRKAIQRQGGTASLKQVKRWYKSGQVKTWAFTGISGERRYGVFWGNV